MQEYRLGGCRLKLGKPQQVTEGVGHTWFPRLARFPGGELLLTHSLNADTEALLVNASSVHISHDNGGSWDLNYEVAYGASIKAIRPDGAIAGPVFRPYAVPGAPNRRQATTHYVAYEAAGTHYHMQPWGCRIEGLPRDLHLSRNEGKWSKDWPLGLALTLLANSPGCANLRQASRQLDRC
ncbi:MAG: hypothetical protein EXR62_17435 [Chloroflexi bacterium]|nr:hypothetical protein [Chloroflexota bacterium]